MTFMFGVLAEYQYIIMNQFFVKTKLETGLNSFNSNINGSDVKDSLYFIAGISIGWNGF